MAQNNPNAVRDRVADVLKGAVSPCYVEGIADEVLDALGHATYDPDADALYVRFREAEHGRTVEVSTDVLMHVAADGELYAVEVLRLRTEAAAALADAVERADMTHLPDPDGSNTLPVPPEFTSDAHMLGEDIKRGAQQIAREEDDLGPDLGGTPGKMGGGR